MNVFFHTEFVT